MYTKNKNNTDYQPPPNTLRYVTGLYIVLEQKNIFIIFDFQLLTELYINTNIQYNETQES
jgi:hypothetical protein